MSSILEDSIGYLFGIILLMLAILGYGYVSENVVKDEFIAMSEVSATNQRVLTPLLSCLNDENKIKDCLKIWVDNASSNPDKELMLSVISSDKYLLKLLLPEQQKTLAEYQKNLLRQ